MIFRKMILQKLRDFRSLRKGKKAFKAILKHFRKKAKLLDPQAKEKITSDLEALRQALLDRQASAVRLHQKSLEESALAFIQKGRIERFRDSVLSIGFALLVAIVIRQTWFELYTIPTGSMRPTLKESDLLVVSKTDYGLNVPLSTSHVFFDPSLIKRGDIFVFTAANLDMEDANTVYFYLFPGKKQLVKRLVGKPGDTLYFYGGKIYGIDRDGKPIEEWLHASWAQTLEHIPFIRFEGKVEVNNPLSPGTYRSATFYQMNEPVAKLEMGSLGQISGQMKGNPLPHLSDLWGIKNFAMARLLTRAQVEELHPNALNNLEEGVLYLELTHHPSLKEAKLTRDEMGRARPALGLSVSLLPLQKEHLERIAHAMTTCRFTVEKGVAYRHGQNPKDPYFSRHFPKFDLPDGTYEIQNGKASQIHFAGWARELSPTHPIYAQTPEKIQFLYNLGIEFLDPFEPSAQQQVRPSRYAYFRNGDLYLLGAPIVLKEEKSLSLFHQKEKEKQAISTTLHPYLPFEDKGPPLTASGALDIAFIQRHGLKIPEKMYLGLGDNHPMSGDSRQFGFIPEDNIKGTVGFLFSPPGPRWGRLPQPAHAYLNPASLLAITATLLVAIVLARRTKRLLSSPIESL